MSVSNDVSGRSKPTRLFSLAIGILGFLTAVNMMMATGESGWLALLLAGAATGAIGGTVLLEAIRHYQDPEGGELSGRTRRKIAFVVGGVFGAALTPVVAFATGSGGGFPFVVGLVVGFAVSDRVRKVLWTVMAARGGVAGDPGDEHDIRMPTFANDSTREQLAAGAVMMLGFVLSAGGALGIAAAFLAITGR